MPTKIRLALGLMWLLYGWNAIRLLLVWRVVIRADLPITVPLGIIYFVVSVLYVLLIRAVALGRNWARFTYSGLAVIGVGRIVWEWFYGGLTSPLWLIGGGLVILVHSTVLACLYHSSSRPWFNKRATSASNQPAATNAGGQSLEPTLELAGDPPVSVRSVKVLAGKPQAMSSADALAGLKEALPYIQQAAKQSEAEGKTPSGSFVCFFVIEPDGMIRILGRGKERRLTGGNPEGMIEGFGASTMSNKWRFPTSGGQTIIEVEFVIGQRQDSASGWVRFGHRLQQLLEW